MTAKKLAVGAALEAWCTKCKEDKPHVVETVKKDGSAWKVQCEVCQGSHLYRAPRGPDGVAPKKKSGGSKGKGKGPAVTEAEAAGAKEYVVGGDFAAGDVLRHARFGVGKVMEVRPGGKMLVAFPDGQRLLLCRDVPTVGKRRAAALPRVLAVAVAAPVEEEAEPAAEDVDVEDVAVDDVPEVSDDDIETDDEEE